MKKKHAENVTVSENRVEACKQKCENDIQALQTQLDTEVDQAKQARDERIREINEEVQAAEQKKIADIETINAKIDEID